MAQNAARLSPDKRREQILVAISRLVFEDKYATFSITEVTKRLGITRSLFYHYFPDKETAIRAAIEDHAERLVTSIRVRYASYDELDPERMVAILAKGILTLANEYPRKSMPGLMTANSVAYNYLAHCLAHTMAAESERAVERVPAYGRMVRVPHLYEAVYTLVYGLGACLQVRPCTSEQTVREVVRSALHLETTPATAGA